jgi:hypothetical protein
MRTFLAITLLLLCRAIYAQSQIESINAYVDSIDGIITSATGLPGEISCNTVTTSRVVRAIGPQETRIGFYFMQKEDSATEGSEGVIFVPKLNQPLKILVEYNIAASQHVKVSYYFDKDGVFAFRKYESIGEYGDKFLKQWYTGTELLAVEIFEDGKRTLFDKTEDIPAQQLNTSIVTRESSKIYKEMYYNLFNLEQIEK